MAHDRPAGWRKAGGFLCLRKRPFIFAECVSPGDHPLRWRIAPLMCRRDRRVLRERKLYEVTAIKLAQYSRRCQILATCAEATRAPSKSSKPSFCTLKGTRQRRISPERTRRLFAAAQSDKLSTKTSPNLTLTEPCAATGFLAHLEESYCAEGAYGSAL